MIEERRWRLIVMEETVVNGLFANDPNGDIFVEKICSCNPYNAQKSRCSLFEVNDALRNLIRRGILTEKIPAEGAFMVCHDGIAGMGTFSSCLHLWNEYDLKPRTLYITKREHADILFGAFQRHEKNNGRRAVHLKEIVWKDGRYCLAPPH